MAIAILRELKIKWAKWASYTLLRADQLAASAMYGLPVCDASVIPQAIESCGPTESDALPVDPDTTQIPHL
jgi:hypothetical protein